MSRDLEPLGWKDPFCRAVAQGSQDYPTVGRPDAPPHCRLGKEAGRPEWGWNSNGGFDFEVIENASEITCFFKLEKTELL